MAVPAAVIWEITKQCNFDCAHCIVSSTKTRPDDEMDTKTAKKFIDNYAQAGGKYIFFSGGEPLLRKDLEEIIHYAKEKGFNGLSIASNGTLLTKERLSSLAKSGVTAMQFSLDGPDPQSNAKTRGTGKNSFRKTLEALRMARDAGMSVTVGTFLNPGNIDLIPEMIELCRRECIPLLRFSGFIPLGKGRNQEIVDKMHYSLEQMKNFFSFISTYNPNKTGVAIGFDHAFGPFMEEFHCVAGKEIFYLSSNGDVYPCPSFLHPHFNCGNIVEKDFENFEKILNSDKMKSCQTSIDKIEGDCAQCEDLSWCKGGCRGVAYAYKEKLDASFPNCLRKLQKEFFKAFPDIVPHRFSSEDVKPFALRPVYRESKIPEYQKKEPVKTNPLTGRALQYSTIFGEDFPGPRPEKTVRLPAFSKKNPIEEIVSIKSNTAIKQTTPTKQNRQSRYAPLNKGKYSHPAMKKAKKRVKAEKKRKQEERVFVYAENPGQSIDRFYKAHAHNLQCYLENPQLSYLLWEATKNCNFNCKHCSSPREDWKKTDELTTKQAKEIFKRFASEFDVSQIHALGITGGEPTLRQDLPELVEYFINLGFHVGLDTNGYITGKKSDLIRKLATAGLRNICFSLDGLKEEFKAFRGIDGFPQVIKSIKFIKSHYPQIFVQTITMVNKHNFNSLEKMYNLLEDLGVEYARFGTIMAVGRAPGDEMNFLDADETRKLLTWIAEKKRNYLQGKSKTDVEFTDNGWCGRMDEPFGFEGLIRQGCFICSAGISMGVVTYNGKFGGCLSVIPELNIQGDLLKERPSVLWRKKFQVFRDKNRLHTGPCVGCEEWEYCQGGGMHERDINRNMRECTFRKIKFDKS